MKTLTEFFGMNLKQAAQTRKELIVSGKTPEELTGALGEALKMEGDRLNHLIHALDAVGTRVQDLKRVVVFTLNEGEKAPQKAVQKGEHYYLVEYYPTLERAQPRGPSDRFEKGDKKGRKNQRRGRRGDRTDQRKPDSLASGSDPKGEGAEGEEKRRRRPRRFPKRAPHPQASTQPTTGRIIPRSEKLAQEAAAAHAAATALSSTPNTTAEASTPTGESSS